MNDGLLFFKVYKTFPQHFKLRQKSPLKLPYAFIFFLDMVAFLIGQKGILESIKDLLLLHIWKIF